MALKKAMIIVHKGSKTENVQVMFNPGEYTLDTNNSYSWKTVPGLSMPIAQFVSGGTTTLSMDFYFDTYEKGTDVRLLTKKISGLSGCREGDPCTAALPVCLGVSGFQGGCCGG